MLEELSLQRLEKVIPPRNMSVDEVAWQKWHKYVTNVIDIYVLNYFVGKITSAISERINNKIKRLKRMAYGYRYVKYFLLKIHQHCGLLSPKFST